MANGINLSNLSNIWNSAWYDPMKSGGIQSTVAKGANALSSMNTNKAGSGFGVGDLNGYLTLGTNFMQGLGGLLSYLNGRDALRMADKQFKFQSDLYRRQVNTAIQQAANATQNAGNVAAAQMGGTDAYGNTIDASAEQAKQRAYTANQIQSLQRNAYN